MHPVRRAVTHKGDLRSAHVLDQSVSDPHNLALEFGYYIAMIAPALMATGLHISFTCLGVRDLTDVSLFRALVIHREVMPAVSITVYGLTVLIRLIGSLFYLFSARAGAAQRKPAV